MSFIYTKHFKILIAIEARTDQINIRMMNMRAMIDLFEAFNESLPIQWTKTDQKWVGTVDIGDTPLEFVFIRYLNNWDCKFRVDTSRASPEMAAQARPDPYKVTGTAGASSIKVFSTFIQALHDLVSERSPDVIYFTGQKSGLSDDGSGKAGLYSRLLQRFAGLIHQLGYEAHIEDSESYLTFTIEKL